MAESACAGKRRRVMSGVAKRLAVQRRRFMRDYQRPEAPPPEERPPYYQSAFEQALYVWDYVAPPPRAPHEDEE